MMKSKILTVILTIFNLLGYSQNYWEIIEVPDSIKILDIAANNQGHLFLATGKNNGFGGIYRSTDGCSTWEFLIGNQYGNYTIHFNEYNQVYIDWHGDIYKSIDNGENWYMVYDAFYSIVCITSYPGGLMFANSGASSYKSIIRSTDYGNNWEEVAIYPNNVEMAYDIEIINNDTVYACTTDWFDGGGVYRSTDGGDNWQHIGMYNFHCFALAKNSTGDVFVGTYGHNTQYWLSGVYVLYHGEDEWVQLYSNLVNDMEINSLNHLFVATDYGVALSTDNGQSFEYINEGLFDDAVDNLAIDSSGYIYASLYDPCHFARSLESTITGFQTPANDIKDSFIFNYPNPVQEKTVFFINNENMHEGVFTIQVYNSEGQLCDEIKSVITQAAKTSVPYNAGCLPAGIYFYHTFLNKQHYTNRFIKY